MRKRLPPRRSSALKLHVRDLNLTPLKRYVDIQRERGRILSIDKVDVDLEQVVERRFLCDRHRCIQWTPHEKKADARPLIDNSCCSHYSVPVADMDRKKLQEILPLVRKRLRKDHPLNEEPEEPPYHLDNDYSFAMNEFDSGACQFVLYEKGLTTCAIHKTCLEEGLDVWEYKPIGCSLWPLALVDYDDDGKERLLMTAYTAPTANLFDDKTEEEAQEDEGHFACLVDNDPDYEPLYRSTEGIITYLLGEAFYRKLDAQAQKHLARRRAQPGR